MRNALGLMLASVVTALVIAAVWFFTASPRAQLAAATPVSAPPAGQLLPARDDVEVTSAIPAKASASLKPSTSLKPSASAQASESETRTTACANLDPLGA